ncbi:hypothetical protein VTH06DRAFT_3757 [Thermothelomyces fergusii]
MGCDGYLYTGQELRPTNDTMSILSRHGEAGAVEPRSRAGSELPTGRPMYLSVQPLGAWVGLSNCFLYTGCVL